MSSLKPADFGGAVTHKRDAKVAMSQPSRPQVDIRAQCAAAALAFTKTFVPASEEAIPDYCAQVAIAPQEFDDDAAMRRCCQESL